MANLIIPISRFICASKKPATTFGVDFKYTKEDKSTTNVTNRITLNKPKVKPTYIIWQNNHAKFPELWIKQDRQILEKQANMTLRSSRFLAYPTFKRGRT